MKNKSFKLKNKPTKKKKKGLFILLILLFLVGILATQADNILNHFVQHNQTTQFQKLSAEELAKNNKKKASFDYDAVQIVNDKKIMESLLSDEGASDNYVVAGLSIPSVGIRLDIYKGVSDYALLRGAGTYLPNQQMGKGNYILAGHNMEDGVTLFSPLYRIKNGALIYLSDGRDIYTYQVYDISTISSTTVEVLNEKVEEPIVTLLTCADRYAINRICVKGKLVEKIAVQEASSKIKQVFR